MTRIYGKIRKKFAKRRNPRHEGKTRILERKKV